MKHLPNLITLANLFCGTLAAIYAVHENYVHAGFFVMLGVIFDFFDGFFARLLKASGNLGKELDSLADMVTSGVVPGIIMFKLLQNNLEVDPNSFIHDEPILDVPLIGLFLTLGAGYRLAKFNIDTRQSDYFIGLPTPAMSLFVISLPLIQQFSEVEFAKDLISNNYVLISITWILAFLMNAELPLFSLKFKSYSLKKNFVKYLFLVTSLVLILIFPFLSIPIIIILYIIFSFFKRKEVLNKIE